MTKMKLLVLCLAVLVLACLCAVTVSAVGQDAGRTAQGQAAVADYAAEEMAVGAYYLSGEAGL